MHKINSSLRRTNIKRAKVLWPDCCSRNTLKTLRELTTKFGFSVELGEISVIGGRWYVTHSGLLQLATRRRCKSISVEAVPQFSDPATNRWVFKCTVQKSYGSPGFVGFGDAEPSNVSPLVRGAEMRVAETRAVNRALRKAYGIGLCSVEELGSFASVRSEQWQTHRFPPSKETAHHMALPKLRDRLCLLIRKYDLDAAQVKRYAAEFCGAEVLRRRQPRSGRVVHRYVGKTGRNRS